MPAADNGALTPGFDSRLTLSEETIRGQLERILASPEFQSSAMLRNFLVFVVEKTLAGEADEIKGYTVATQVLGRQPDFDPDKDPIVRILAGKLRWTLERYYLVRGRPDPVRIDIPKGAYVPTFQQASREEAGGEGPAALATDPALSLPSGPSVAVMPLLNLTGDRKQEFFAHGLAEEL